MKNRILLYVHFNKKGEISDHVKYQLEKIRDIYSRIVFISNSQISEDDKKSISNLFDDFLQRENIGFDFAAWRDGMNLIGWKELSKFDSVTLMNDTCFGPIYPLEDIYEKMENQDVDFWGITDHDKTMIGMPGTNAPTPKHIQSYFTCYNKAVVKSKIFQSFWGSVKDYSDVQRVIQDYETAVTGILEKNGFKSASYFDTKKYSAENGIVDLFNYSELAPLILIEQGAPFVKIKAFAHTSYKELVNSIKQKTKYPAELINNHLKQMNLPMVGAQEFLLFRAKRKAAHLLRSNKTIMEIAKRNPKMVKFTKKVARKLTGNNEIMVIQHAPAPKPQPNKNEITFNDLYDPNHAIRKAEHEVLLANNKTYYFEKESDKSFVRDESDPRVVAIYLPQYHPFPENDKAWGKGFTEWTNVTSSIPRFVGQEQPVLPSDLGFYDLRIPGKMKEQIDLAKKYGIYGFQFYYYWFSGKKVMEFPIEEFYKNKDWDFNYSICWANENWTRRWDGSENDVIFEQKDAEDDPLKFIKDVAYYLNDDRYIQENGRPILTVYRVDLLEDPKRYAKIWRDYFREKYGKELWLIGCTNFKNFTPEEVGFDALMDMTPTNSSNPEIKPWVTDKKFLTDKVELLDKNWDGVVLDYRYMAKEEIKHLSDNINYYKTISPSWCNEARRKGVNGFTFHKSSPEIFANWLDRILDFDINVKKKKSPLVFINAWNEWAEAAMLEPSVHLGHNTLLRVSEVIAKYSKNKKNISNFPAYRFQVSKKAKLAVVIHLFYPNMWMKISEKLQNLSEDFDLYVTVSDSNKNIDIAKINKYHQNTNIIVVPNRGRDVLPFVTIAARIRQFGQYEYILKMHTKKSLHRKDGAKWLDELLDSLLPQNTQHIIEKLKNQSTGAIGPKEHVVSLSRHLGGNEAKIKGLLDNEMSLDETEVKKIFKNLDRYPYFGGTMFWCRMDYLDPLLDLFLMPSDFDSEKGQIDGTTAHAVERILGKILHEKSGKTMYQIDANAKISKVEDKSFDEVYKYAK